MQTFKSKIDVWLGSILTFSILLCLGASVAIGLRLDFVNLLLATFVALTGVILPLWVIMTTRYIVENETLKIKSGPFTWLIPTENISSVKETRTPLSSPALSLDRLEIKYSGGKTVMVSPVDKTGFLSAIAQKV